jgi:hypothetical protein
MEAVICRPITARTGERLRDAPRGHLTRRQGSRALGYSPGVGADLDGTAAIRVDREAVVPSAATAGHTDGHRRPRLMSKAASSTRRTTRMQ